MCPRWHHSIFFSKSQISIPKKNKLRWGRGNFIPYGINLVKMTKFGDFKNHTFPWLRYENDRLAHEFWKPSHPIQASIYYRFLQEMFTLYFCFSQNVSPLVSPHYTNFIFSRPSFTLSPTRPSCSHTVSGDPACTWAPAPRFSTAAEYCWVKLSVRWIGLTLSFYLLFSKKNNKFIYLFIFGCVGSSLLHAGFLWGLRSSLRCAGFSLWWLLLLQSTGSRLTGFSSCGAQAQQLWLVGSRERRLSSCGARA